MNTMNHPLLSCTEINPEEKAIGSVIWLHGLGADGSDFVPIAKELNLPKNLPLRFIFPDAPLQPVTLNNGYVMRAWYDIYSMALDQKFDHEGIQRSVKLLEHLIQREEELGIPTDKIILAGFSQGAVVALTTGITYSKKLAGIIALSGYLPDAEKILAKAHANQKTPFFVAHGNEDSVVPFFLGTMIADVLRQHDYPVELHQYAMMHSVCAREIQDIATWIKKIF